MLIVRHISVFKSDRGEVRRQLTVVGIRYPKRRFYVVNDGGFWRQTRETRTLR